MKVKIGPYTDRWTCQIHYDYMNKKYNYKWEDNTNTYESFLEKAESVLQWIYNHTVNLYLDNKQRKIKVKIHKYDTWSMDNTLAYIIHPMLIQLKATKHGAPNVDPEDVPEKLRPTEEWKKAYKGDGSTDPDFFNRWDWVLDEMIYAFESKTQEDDEEYFFGEWVEDKSKTLGGSFKNVDWDGLKAHQARVANGFRLFGKYYQALWD